MPEGRSPNTPPCRQGSLQDIGPASGREGACRRESAAGQPIGVAACSFPLDPSVTCNGGIG